MKISNKKKTNRDIEKEIELLRRRAGADLESPNATKWLRKADALERKMNEEK